MAEPPKATNSRFEGLRAELRNHILLNIISDSGQTYKSLCEDTLNIALTSKSLRQQVLPLFFGNNIFRSVANFVAMQPESCSVLRPTDPQFKSGIWGKPGSKEPDEASTDPDETTVVYGYSQQISGIPYQCYAIEFAHVSYRKLVRHLQLSLLVPEKYGPKQFSSSEMYGPMQSRRSGQPFMVVDWLYPLRELDELGFTGLVSLKVEVRIGIGIDPIKYSQRKAELMKWVDEKMQQMTLPEKLEVVYVDAR